MPADLVLKVESISKRFGGLQALSDVSFEVHQGEILGLIGPNGAGKSTLFETLSGNVFPTSGKVSFLGEDITRLAPHLRRRKGLCRTFQKVRLFDSLTVEENVRIAALETMHSTADADRAVKETLDRMGIGHIRAREVTEITLADRKRVEIARAMVGQCKLIMLDEALCGLTHEEGEAMVAEIRDINRTHGITVIIVEHVMPVMMALAQRLVVLSYGKLLAHGTPSEIANNPVVIEAYLGKRKAIKEAEAQ